MFFNNYNNTKLIIYFIFVLIHIHSFEIFSFCVSWFEFMRSLIHQKMTEKLYFMKKINDVKIWINKSKFNNWMFLFNFYLFLFYFLFIFCNENEKWKTNENSLNNIFYKLCYSKRDPLSLPNGTWFFLISPIIPKY